MSELPPAATPPDLDQPEDVHRAVAEVSLRLMAGAVDRRTLDQLRRTVQASPGEFPWQVVTQAVLAGKSEPQQLVQAALIAQRDWILRGGRETPRPLGRRAKGLLAKLCAQLIVFFATALVAILALMLLKHRFPEVDIYRFMDWVVGLFGGAR